MKSAILSVLFLFVFCPGVFAGSISLDFNDHSTQLRVSQKLDTPQYGDSVVKARYLYNEVSRTNLAGIAAGVVGTPGNIDGLKLGLDVTLNGGRTDADQDLLAAGLGFLAEFAPPALPGLGINAQVTYSPEIFAFVDADDYFEWGFGASYLVLPNAKIMLSFQNIQVDLKNSGEVDLDDTLRFGIKFEF